MDLDGLNDVLRGIEDGDIRCVAVDTPVPSQFSHEILNANPYAYLDDAPLEERRARAVEMRGMVPESVLEEVGARSRRHRQVREEAWPDVRDADELHDALHTLVALPEQFPFPGDLNEADPRGARTFGTILRSTRTTTTRPVIAEQGGTRLLGRGRAVAGHSDHSSGRSG